MKRLTSRAVTLFAACMSVNPLLGQHEHHGMTHATTADVRLEVNDDAQARVLTLRLGPVNLPVHSDHHAVAQPSDQFLMIPFDGWLVAYHPRLLDDTGQTLPSRLMHHVGFWNTTRSDLLCPSKEEHIFGAGGEMNDWPKLLGVGYRVARGERIRIGTMFHNPTDQSHPKTFLQVRVEYERLVPDAAQLKSVYPTWFDVQECRASGYDLKPGKNVNTGEFTLRYAGTLLGVGGHLHDYGQELRAENATRKEEIARLESKLDARGRILFMPIVMFTDRGGYRLNADEVVRITATYDNVAGKPLPEGAMGIVVGYFLPDSDAQMAALKRSNHSPEASRQADREW